MICNFDRIVCDGFLWVANIIDPFQQWYRLVFRAKPEFADHLQIKLGETNFGGFRTYRGEIKIPLGEIFRIWKIISPETLVRRRKSVSKCTLQKLHADFFESQ